MLQLVYFGRTSAFATFYRKLLNHCAGCGGGSYPRGHWCFVMCSGPGRRSLTVTDEQAHTERFLVEKGHVQQAANECLDRKIQEGYECLGNPQDLTIKIYFS
jgi:hypothetical protein